MSPDSRDDFTLFVLAMVGIFFFSGIGNASVFKQIPGLFDVRKTAGVVGWTGAVAAYGPFFVAVQLPKAGDVEGLGAIIAALEGTEGVAKTIPNTEMLPLVGASLQDATITAIQVNPATGPQDVATDDLVNRLRDETLPPVTAATSSASAWPSALTLMPDAKSR